MVRAGSLESDWYKCRYIYTLKLNLSGTSQVTKVTGKNAKNRSNFGDTDTPIGSIYGDTGTVTVQVLYRNCFDGTDMAGPESVVRGINGCAWVNVTLNSNFDTSS
jgi:hypothetical protein